MVDAGWITALLMMMLFIIIIIISIQFIIIKRGFPVSDMLCLNGSLPDLYIYVNYSILYSCDKYICLSVCLVLLVASVPIRLASSNRRSISTQSVTTEPIEITTSASTRDAPGCTECCSQN